MPSGDQALATLTTAYAVSLCTLVLFMPLSYAVAVHLGAQIWVFLPLYSQEKSEVMCILIRTPGGLLKVKARITAFTSGRVAVIWAVQLRWGWKESSWGFKSSHLSTSPSSCPILFICLPPVLREPWDSPKCIQYIGTFSYCPPFFPPPFLTGMFQEFSRLQWTETTKNYINFIWKKPIIF